MKKYHVNIKGEIATCTAKAGGRGCPYDVSMPDDTGGGIHVEKPEDGRRAFEAVAADAYTGRSAQPTIYSEEGRKEMYAAWDEREKKLLGIKEANAGKKSVKLNAEIARARLAKSKIQTLESMDSGSPSEKAMSAQMLDHDVDTYTRALHATENRGGGGVFSVFKKKKTDESF